MIVILALMCFLVFIQWATSTITFEESVQFDLTGNKNKDFFRYISNVHTVNSYILILLITVLVMKRNYNQQQFFTTVCDKKRKVLLVIMDRNEIEIARLDIVALTQKEGEVVQKKEFLIESSADVDV